MNTSGNDCWLEVRINAACDSARVEESLSVSDESVASASASATLLEEWLFAAGALSVTITDSLSDNELDHAVLEPLPGEVRLWNDMTLVGLFDKGASESATTEALNRAATEFGLGSLEFQISPLRDQVWERSWMDSFKPMQFGPHLWICPTATEPPAPEAINIRLDPGLAFGTGTHATTAQCLEWLGEQTKTGLQPLKGRRVIDYGCGSGVLGIAALLLGAEHVWAVDIDEQALIATQANAATNQVLERLSVGQPESLNDVEADIVLANILFKPLMELADTLAERTVAGGALVMSGILEAQMEPLRMRYNQSFKFANCRASEGWALMTATRL